MNSLVFLAICTFSLFLSPHLLSLSMFVSVVIVCSFTHSLTRAHTHRGILNSPLPPLLSPLQSLCHWMHATFLSLLTSACSRNFFLTLLIACLSVSLCVSVSLSLSLCVFRPFHPFHPFLLYSSDAGEASVWMSSFIHSLPLAHSNQWHVSQWSLLSVERKWMAKCSDKDCERERRNNGLSSMQVNCHSIDDFFPLFRCLSFFALFSLFALPLSLSLSVSYRFALFRSQFHRLIPSQFVLEGSSARVFSLVVLSFVSSRIE